MIYLIVLGIGLMILEILTPGIFFFFTLGLAVIINSVVYSLSGSYTATLVGVAITTSILYYLIKKYEVFKPKNDYQSNINAYVGKTAIVQDVLSNNEYRVKVFSEVWTAKSEEKLAEGDICEVIDRKNNTLIISKK